MEQGYLLGREITGHTPAVADVPLELGIQLAARLKEHGYPLVFPDGNVMPQGAEGVGPFGLAYLQDAPRPMVLLGAVSLKTKDVIRAELRDGHREYRKVAGDIARIAVALGIAYEIVTLDEHVLEINASDPTD